MNIKEIKDLAHSKITLKAFFKNNELEILSFIKDIENNKSSIQVYCENVVPIVEKDILNILNMYLTGDIFEWELEYIFRVIDCLEDSSELVSDIAFTFSDPYLGKVINPKNVSIAIQNLNDFILRDSKKRNLGKAKLREFYRTKFSNM